jgi:hypothetical protein
MTGRDHLLLLLLALSKLESFLARWVDTGQGDGLKKKLRPGRR